jgi:hemerythrin superfamily protein
MTQEFNKTTIDDLAIMMNRSFKHLEGKIDILETKVDGVQDELHEFRVDTTQRLGRIDERLEHIEDTMIREDRQRIERLEDKLIQVEVILGKKL